MKVTSATVALLLVLSPLLAMAGENDAPHRFEKNFHAIKTLSARFSQTLTSKGFGATGEATGTMYLSRPGKMRWEYDRPEGKRVVADGSTLWLYEPDDKTVYRQPEEGLLNGRSPALFLTGTAPLAELFDITPVRRKNEKMTEKDTQATFRLIPKEATIGLKGMLLKLADDGTPLSLTAVDHLGSTNRFDFTDVQKDPDLNPELFIFTPPAGTRVVETSTR